MPHTTVGLGPGEAAWLPPVAPRAYASRVHCAAEAGDDAADVATGEDAVRLPLPGGWVTTAWGMSCTGSSARSPRSRPELRAG